MKTFQSMIAGGFLALALSGCVRNTIVVAGAPYRPIGVPAVSCWVPDDKQQNYRTPHEPFPTLFVAPKVAQQQHLNGCAAIIFQLTEDGKARNLSVLREYPAGYGFPTTLSDQIRHSTFDPPASRDDWYYRAASVTFARR